MRLSISRFLTAGAVVGVVAVFAFLGMVRSAQAAVGDLTVTVSREADAAVVSGVAISIDCDDDDQAAPLTAMGTTNGSGQLLMSKAAIEATGCIEPGSSGGENMTIYAARNGYVTKSVLYDWHDHNDGLTASVTGLQFTYRINVLTNELGTNIMPTSGTPWTGSGGAALVAQVYSAGS